MSERAPGSFRAQPSAAPTLRAGEVPRETVAVPAKARFEGLLSFEGAATIEGTLRGQVFARGRLRIGPRADVEAQIEVDELIVEGRVRGPLFARTRLVLTASADVEGPLQAPRVELREGSRFSGRCCSGARAEAAGSSAGENPPAPS